MPNARKLVRCKLHNSRIKLYAYSKVAEIYKLPLDDKRIFAYKRRGKHGLTVKEYIKWRLLGMGQHKKDFICDGVPPHISDSYVKEHYVSPKDIVI